MLTKARLLSPLIASSFVIACAFAMAACRGCDEGSRDNNNTPEASASGVRMPVGMLNPLPDGAAASAYSASAAGPRERLAIAHGKTKGEWAELQVASANDPPGRMKFEHWKSDSRFLSLDAMTLLHDPFARASPGFDLFLPRLLDPPALGRLRSELASMKSSVSMITTAAAAKARWGEVSSFVNDLKDDAAWLDARGSLLTTIDELGTLAADLEKKGQGLWVLGMGDR